MVSNVLIKGTLLKFTVKSCQNSQNTYFFEKKKKKTQSSSASTVYFGIEFFQSSIYFPPPEPLFNLPLHHLHRCPSFP